MNQLLAFTVSLAMLALAGGCDRQLEIEPSGKVVKIGFVGPFSGPNLAMGQEGIKGVETAIKSNPLLHNGDAVEVILVDDRNEPVRTVEAISSFAEDDTVTAIVLMSSSASALEAGAAADAHKIPVLATLATHNDVTRGHPFISQLGFDNTVQGSVAALFVRDELLLEKVAVIRDQGSFYSSQLADEFVRKFRSIGGAIMDIRALEKTTGRYPEVLATLRDRGTELLYLPVEAPEVIRIVNAVDEIGWLPTLMGGDGLLAGTLTQYPDDVGVLEGMYATDFFSDDMPVTTYGKKVSKAYESLFDSPATSYVVLGVEGYRVLYEAINRCTNPVDRECVNRMIRNTRDLEGVTGKLSIDAKGKATRPLVINTIRAGHMKFVVKVY